MARSNRGRSPKQKLLDAERRGVALDVYRKGFRGDAAAAEMRRLGYPACNRTTWYRLVQHAIADLWVPAAEETKALELARLEKVYRRGERSLTRLERLIEAYSASAVIAGKNGQPVVGSFDAAELVIKAETALAKANDQHIKSSESRRKLLGVDAPEEHNVTGSLSVGPTVFVPAERPDDAGASPSGLDAASGPPN